MLIQKNKNIFSKILILLILSSNIFADPPQWDPDGECVLNNYNDYENNGSITARIYADDGEEIGQLGDMIAGFVNTEQRGIGCAAEAPAFLGGGTVFLMMLYSNESNGETLTFQYYSTSEDFVYTCNETLEFTTNMIAGDVSDSFALTLNYSNVCEDESACNTGEQGSCEYATENFDCDGNCTVETDCLDVCGGDAVEDCEGNCNGSAFFDNCNNCITNPVDGCIEDCNGVWGGSAQEDECGVCNGSGLNENGCCFNEAPDCAGECAGDAQLDDCGICNGPGVNEYGCCDDENTDCAGECGGTAVLDNCDICVEGNTGLTPCPGYNYELSLNVGANLISFYALPEDRSLDYILSSNTNDYMYAILGLTNSAVNIGENTWIGSLTSINENSGYWFKTINTEEFLIQEVWDIDPNIVYDLTEGANLLSFPSADTYLLDSAIGSESEDYFDAIIGQSEIAVRINGEWEGSLDYLSGGKGYYFILNSSHNFSYTLTDVLSKYQIIDNNEILHKQSSLQSFYFIDPLALSQIEDGDWLLAYKNNILVGSRKYNLESFLDIPVMGDEGTPYTKGYCIEGDTPIFKILKKSGEYIDLHLELPKWSNLSINFIDANISTDINPYKTKLNSVYPNPFNPSINLDFEIENNGFINIYILDINGRLVDTVYDGHINKGSYSYIWDAHSFTSGIYFVNITTSNKVLSKKITLIK